MRTISALEIQNAVARLYVKACYQLPEGVTRALLRRQSEEDWPVAREILGQLLENSRIGSLPLCQDTGLCCVFLEIGQDVHIQGDIAAAVDEGVRRAVSTGYLRASAVGDPLIRVNTGDNTPAMLYTELTGGEELRVTVAPKGFGSENMSAIKMLTPSAGAEGVMDFVVETVEKAGPNPCPPVMVGIGLGGTFDKAALLAKKALLREPDDVNPVEYYAEMEEKLLERINALGIGPQGLGGRTTALAVKILTMPTHIAGLPCAVNINCHAARHITEVL